MTRTASRTAELATGWWLLDPARSSAEFEVPSFYGLATVTGRFRRYVGTLNMSDPPAVALVIEADSLETGNRRRDNHLRSAAFFDAAEYPWVRFEADAAELDGDEMQVRGDTGVDAVEHGGDLPHVTGGGRQVLEVAARLIAPVEGDGQVLQVHHPVHVVDRGLPERRGEVADRRVEIVGGVGERVALAEGRGASRLCQPPRQTGFLGRGVKPSPPHVARTNREL